MHERIRDLAQEPRQEPTWMSGEAAGQRERLMHISIIAIVLSFVLSFVLSGCNLIEGTPATVTPAPDLPTVQFIYPANESTIVEGTDFPIDIVASDNGVGIARVQLLVDDEPINERGPDVSAAVPVFTVRMNWLAQGVGRHVLTAWAYRPDGTASDPATILVNVLPENGDLSALTPPAGATAETTAP